ncbi:MAG: MBL fold metallo-hydrolase, partial [Oscillospiraceae bacterium]|nr:MBL fold metallo-hydrolase [Oscillospiraceae bacterium]
MAELRFIRTFHPVGQGAFYSEEFEIDGKETFTMVYDCGSSTISPLDKYGKLKKNSKLQKIIKSDLGTKEIDLLFLSHFDADHVNGVELLKPKTIVIPFINPSHKWILDFLGIILGVPKLSSLFLDPRAVFSNNPRVVQVLPAEGNSEDTLFPPNQDPINLANSNAFPGDAKGIHKIPSGTPLTPPVGNRFWEFIPWNPYFSTFFTSFETAVLACKKLDINKLKDTANGKYIKEKLSDLKKIYDNLTPNN